MTIENLIIIGSGPAGYTAAMYAARAGLNPLVIEGKTPGGQLMSTSYVENWPGIKRILGSELMFSMREHAESFGTRFLEQEITTITTDKRPFALITNKNQELHARAVIIATGATPKRLGCPGEDQYWGKGVTTCAVCDGAFYRDKTVIIVGGGDTAMEDASFMTNFTDKIILVHILDKLTASKPMQDRIFNNPKITIIYESTIESIEGNGSHVTHAMIKNKKTGIIEKIAADAIFVAIGLTPNTNIFRSKIELNSYGYVIHKKNTETSVPGIFAAGDVVDYRYRQAITSSASGCMAALDAERFLKENVL